MAVPDLWVSSDVRTQLGDAGVATVADSLYPRDCQTCGRPLKAKPALVVDDLGDTVAASLHHRSCRRSQWDRSGVIDAGLTRPNLSYTAEVVMLPTVVDGVPGGTEAILVLNPSLESVFIERDPIGQWHIEMALAFSETGFCPPGPGLDLTAPVAGAIAKLGRRSLAVTTAGLMSQHFELTATDELLRSVRAAGGILVAVTHALDPSQITSHRDLRPVLEGDRSALGLVTLQDRPAPPVERNPVQPSTGRAGYGAALVCGALGAVALVLSFIADGQLRAVAGVVSGVLCCTAIGLAVFAYRRQLDQAEGAPRP